MKLSLIASKINGALVGEDLDISDISTPEQQTPNSICILAKPKLAEAAAGEAACYIVPKGFPTTEDRAFIILDDGDVRSALAIILELIRPYEPPTFA
ncbi:MAG: hypothetical protein LBP51_03205, partial [Deferribacteraceae bacterium]|nr:hypothetical protein [Deferribacteraceae bacterium]